MWTSSIHGTIGTGGAFSLSTLPVGVHTIMLTATDSDGMTTTQSITVTIDTTGKTVYLPIVFRHQ